MKKLFLFFVLLSVSFGLASCDYHDKVIEPNQLPTVTTDFIKVHFPECKIISVDKDRDIEGITYDVVLDCGVNLEFNSKGEWREVDCEPNQVPDAIVPATILSYVKASYPNSFIEKIEHKHSRYKVELNNLDGELVFDENGNYKHYDD